MRLLVCSRFDVGLFCLSFEFAGVDSLIGCFADRFTWGRLCLGIGVLLNAQ